MNIKHIATDESLTRLKWTFVALILFSVIVQIYKSGTVEITLEEYNKVDIILEERPELTKTFHEIVGDDNEMSEKEYEAFMSRVTAIDWKERNRKTKELKQKLWAKQDNQE